MELPKDSAIILSSIRIGELKGKPKTLADEIMGEFEEEHSISFDERDSLFSLVKLSKKLNKRAKKDKQLLKKMEELVVICKGLEHAKAPVAVERQEQQKQRVAFERGRKQVEVDKLAGQGEKEKADEKKQAQKKEKGTAEKPAPAKEGEEKPAPKGAVAKFVAFINRFNPIYIFDRLKEDYQTVKEAKSLSKSPEPKSSEANVIHARTNMRLLGALCLSEIVGTVFGAPITGSIVQYVTGSAYKGVIGTIVGDYLPAVISFEIAWWAMNRTYYSNCADTFIGKATRFFKDVLPVHALAVVAAIPTYAAVGVLSSGLIAGVNLLVPGLANILPMPVVTETVNVGIAETIYMTLMLGATMDTIVKGVAERYAAFLKSREEHKGPSRA